MQQLTVAGAAYTQGHALVVGEERKRVAHGQDYLSIGVTFIPLVAESLGWWSEEAAITIKAIGRLQGQRSGNPPADAVTHLFQRLSISLWRGNATLWIPIGSPEVDGVI